MLVIEKLIRIYQTMIKNFSSWLSVQLHMVDPDSRSGRISDVKPALLSETATESVRYRNTLTTLQNLSPHLTSRP